MGLTVHVVRARKLTAADFNFASEDSSDPYAVLSVVGEGEDGGAPAGEEHRTATKDATLEPDWGERFAFAGAVSCASRLRVRVLDYDAFGSDDPLGELEVGLKGAWRDGVAQAGGGRVLEGWHRLEGEGGGEGEVLLRIEMRDTDAASVTDGERAGTSAAADRATDAPAATISERQSTDVPPAVVESAAALPAAAPSAAPQAVATVVANADAATSAPAAAPVDAPAARAVHEAKG